jgi:hypothetical protein
MKQNSLPGGFIAILLVLNISACKKIQIENEDPAKTTETSTDVLARSKCDKKTVILRPQNNPFESGVDSYYPTGNGIGVPHLVAGSWTHSGEPEDTRVYIKFDLSSLPKGFKIRSAKLSLYAMAQPLSGNFIDAHYGDANACYVRRITSYWDNTINWGKQPSTTTVNQIILPQSTSSFQNVVNLDVTQLINDSRNTNNYGLAVSLINETPYNIRQYHSSYSTDVNSRPVLVLSRN